ncbi:MAG: glycosyltransferase family 2 protein [Planctomycetota bacterium]
MTRTEPSMKLSVIIPVFNEAATLRECVDAVLNIASENLRLDVLIIDDGSTDESRNIAAELAAKHDCIKLTVQPGNQGKGAAVRLGFDLVTGDFVAIQDADLEYSPVDLLRLIEPIKRDDADVVFGSRFHGRSLRNMSWRQAIHCLGNRSLTWLSNRMTRLALTDMETCYKVFRREVLADLKLDENRFAIEPQLASEIARLRLRVVELPISYQGRGYGEGKKIGLRDAWRAGYCILFRSSRR